MLITIAHAAGNDIRPLAESLSKKINFPVIDTTQLLVKIFSPLVSEQMIRQLQQSSKVWLHTISPENSETFLSVYREKIQELAKLENFILIDHNAALILGEDPYYLHLKIIVPNTVKHTDELKQLERSIRRHQLTLCGRVAEEADYHAIFNLHRMAGNCCISAVQVLLSEFETLQKIASPRHGDEDACIKLTAIPHFKNDDEREFADILDLYQIDWRYEPRFFPVEWDEQGRVSLAFSPDFYLPKFNLYLELTTMNQKYVSQKNKKLRLLRELYPGINVKIVYKKDFESLLQRFE